MWQIELSGKGGLSFIVQGGAKMLTVTDSGCHKHRACQLSFSGASASMVERLIANLPIIGGEFTYLCEHGQTHLVIPFSTKQEIAVNSMDYEKFSPQMFIDLMA
jgi:hypothetical protein